jgi:hypothetical protein
MRIIGHGIDVERVAEINEELESPTKKWAEQFCSPSEREQADLAGALPLLRRQIRRQGGRREGVGYGVRR